MPEEPTLNDVIAMAATAFLHKTLKSTLEVRISVQDMDNFFAATEGNGEAIAFDYDPSNGDVILRHRSPRHDA